MEPGLVAVYDIRSGNGAGLFFQPRSPHGASDGQKDKSCDLLRLRLEPRAAAASRPRVRGLPAAAPLSWDRFNERFDPPVGPARSSGALSRDWREPRRPPVMSAKPIGLNGSAAAGSVSPSTG